MNSVRLRLVDGLKRIIDQCREYVAKVLREHQAHAEPACGVDMGSAAISAQGTERYVNDIGHVPPLSNDVYEELLATVLAKGNIDIPQSDLLGSSYNHFLNHQQPLLGENHPDLAKLNASFAGVDRRRK